MGFYITSVTALYKAHFFYSQTKPYNAKRKEEGVQFEWPKTTMKKLRDYLEQVINEQINEIRFLETERRETSKEEEFVENLKEKNKYSL